VQVAYRPIDGWPGYRVGDDGSIWSRKRGRWGNGEWRELKLHVTQGSGYYYVVLSRRDPALTKRFYVHHLVLRGFVGLCPRGADACHGNGIRTDNNLPNLRWGSRAENVADARKHGTIARGERSGASKLTEADVRAIR
jgi:hypothetical protein